MVVTVAPVPVNLDRASPIYSVLLLHFAETFLATFTDVSAFTEVLRFRGQDLGTAGLDP